MKLIEVDVQGTIESQTGGDRRHNLSNESVEMFEVRAWDIEITTADFVDSFVVNQEGAIRVLDSAVGRKDGIVGFDYRGGDTRRRIDSEFELRFLAEVG